MNFLNFWNFFGFFLNFFDLKIILFNFKFDFIIAQMMWQNMECPINRHLRQGGTRRNPIRRGII